MAPRPQVVVDVVVVEIVEAVITTTVVEVVVDVSLHGLNSLMQGPKGSEDRRHLGELGSHGSGVVAV